MSLVIPIQRVREEDRSFVGGKAFALSRFFPMGPYIPKAICFSTEAYVQYVAATGLRERILLELGRKPFAEMRWEEIWDASLRI
jgi:phosphoenolpyruvate synthase/pyruvate phosphate dikinase